MNLLHRLSKRSVSTANQTLIKHELSSTITRLDYISSETTASKTSFVNRTTHRGPLTAAILDWAGTVADANVLAPATCFVESFAKYGVPITMAQAREPMGLRKDIHIQKILEMPEVRENWIKIKGHEPTKETVDELYDAFVPMQLDVLGDYTTLIPGVVDSVDIMRNKYGLKIGTTTGFTRAMMDILIASAKEQGYIPDSNVAGDDVENGLGFRPSPFMIYRNLLNLGVWPINSIIKIDDTTSGIEEGLNAGCWTIGVYGWSNYNDIDSKEHWDNMSDKEKHDRRMKSRDILIQSGAHYVAESIIDIPIIIEHVNERLKMGESPMSDINHDMMLK